MVYIVCLTPTLPLAIKGPHWTTDKGRVWRAQCWNIDDGVCVWECGDEAGSVRVWPGVSPSLPRPPAMHTPPRAPSHPGPPPRGWWGAGVQLDMWPSLAAPSRTVCVCGALITCTRSINQLHTPVGRAGHTQVSVSVQVYRGPVPPSPGHGRGTSLQTKHTHTYGHTHAHTRQLFIHQW